MATLQLTLQAAPTQPHRRVTIRSKAGTSTLPLTSVSVAAAGFGHDWQEIPRPGRDPLLVDAGLRRGTIQLTGTLIGRAPDGSIDPNVNVEGLMGALESHAHAGRVIVAYGPREAGEWAIDDLTFTSVRREQGTNAINEATWQMNLKRPSDLTLPTTSTATRSAQAVEKLPAPGAPDGLKTWTVRTGDTPSAIAAAVHGDPGAWGPVLSANGVLDPRRISDGSMVGAVLTLP